MPGTAAVAIWCDVDPAIKDEYDDWHAHEHTPERLAIPGFLRGSRWVSVDGRDSYFILYELDALEVLTAGPYLERLNHPTPWSIKMMPHHRNMVRSLCRVQSSAGIGLGELMLTIRLAQSPDADLIPKLPARKGLVAAHLLRDAGAVQGAPTTEQKIRGGDLAADWIVLVNGYGIDAVTQAAAELGGDAPGSIARTYRLAYVVSARA
ncbi:MAG: hypothetical protein ABI654_08435 [Betaproteobacteria bacterium]